MCLFGQVKRRICMLKRTMKSIYQLWRIQVLYLWRRNPRVPLLKLVLVLKEVQEQWSCWVRLLWDVRRCIIVFFHVFHVKNIYFFLFFFKEQQHQEAQMGLIKRYEPAPRSIFCFVLGALQLIHMFFWWKLLFSLRRTKMEDSLWDRGKGLNWAAVSKVNHFHYLLPYLLHG